MQAVLEKQKSNVIQFPSKTVGGDGGGTSTLVPVVKELISSIKTLTRVMIVMIGQAKGITPAKAGAPTDSLNSSLAKGITPAKAGAPTDSLNSSLETEVETGRYQETQLNVLKKIEENTRPITAEKVKDSKTDGGLSLGGIASIIAIAAGTFAGLVTAWVKTVKLLVVGIGVGIEKMVVFLSKFFPSLKTILFNIEVTVMLLVENMKGIFKNVVGKIGSIFNGAVDFFKGIFGEGSMIGKVITSIKTAVTGFLEPIIAGFKTISEVSGPIGKAVQFVKNALGGFMEFFAGLGTKLGMFGKLFSAVSGVVSKIAFPLMVIMSVWDTVKGALAGWEEGGFVGAIGGAIKGLFNGLVFGVLDMIKGAISWIAGALGFEAVEKFLDSFSFEDIFSSFVDAVLFIPKKIQEFIMSPIESFKKLGSLISDAFKPISAAMGMLVDAALFIPRKIGSLISDAFKPISAAMGKLVDAALFIPKTILELLNDYIIDPLSNAFKPVTTFFKSIAEKVMGFFEDFGIPEIGFDTPLGKVAIGPFYPFKKAAGSSAAATPAAGSSAAATPAGNSDAGAGQSSSQAAAKDPRRLDKTSSKIDVSKSSEEEEKAYIKYSDNRAKGEMLKKEQTDTGGIGVKTSVSDESKAIVEDLTTGLAAKNPKFEKRFQEDKIKPIFSNDELLKMLDDEPQTGKKSAKIVKEDDAYQKLSFSDKIKDDVGYAKASDLLVAASPTKTPTAEKVSQQSSDNAVAKMPTQTAPSNNNIVNAPVTTNNKTTQLIKSPTRNQESSQTKYLDSRYAF